MRYRVGRPSDLAICRGLIHPGLRVSASVREGMTDVWRELLEVNPAAIVVIEDPGRHYPESIEGFAASAFVSDAFAEPFFKNPRPYVAAVFYEECLAGRSPALSWSDLRAGNSSSGVSEVVLHFGLRNHNLNDERTRLVLETASQAFFFFHAGYRLNILLNEVYGRQAADYMHGGGFRLIADFADREIGVPPTDQPFLFGTRREWVTPAAVSQLWFLFQASSPQLGLSHSEQRVLFRALLNESDDEIAANLGVSLDAVKKAWRRAFDRVDSTLPFLLEASRHQRSVSHRGLEKRRHLLDYLRTHLVELRPHERLSSAVSADDRSR